MRNPRPRAKNSPASMSVSCLNSAMRSLHHDTGTTPTPLMTTKRQKIIVASFKVSLLVLDDWGLEQLSREQSMDMLEILAGRYDRGSTIVTA
ncbi:hypothetical protein DFAR_3800006 [Desulfarculales bacterium]